MPLLLLQILASSDGTYGGWKTMNYEPKPGRFDDPEEAAQELNQEEVDAYVDPGTGWAHDDPRWD